MKSVMRIGFGAAIAAAIVTTALAADLPVSRQAVAVSPVIPYSWTGLYVGINGGYGYQTQDAAITGIDTAGIAVVNSGFVPGTVATRGGGALVGGTLGYNWQFNERFVLGAEGDIDWADVKGSGSQFLAVGSRQPVSLSTASEAKLNWMGSIRGRIGYLVTPSSLIYFTGGGAVGGAESNTSIVLTGPGVFNGAALGNSSNTKWGWTLGGGWEQLLGNKWTLKAEYRYTDLGSIDTPLGATVGATPVNFNTHQDLRYHTFLVGLNYKIW